MTLEREIISALKWTTSTKALGQLFSWAATLWVIRLLAPEDYGLMAVATLVLTVTTGLAELGLGAAIVRAPTLSDTDLSKLSGLIITINIGAGILLALSAPAMAFLFDEPRLTDIIRLCSLQFLSGAFGTVAIALASRNLAFRWLSMTSLVASLSSSALTLVLAIGGAGVWALVWGPILDGALRSILLLAGGGWVRPTFRFGGIGKHMRFGGMLTFSRMMWLVIFQADVIIAARIMPASAVGIYAVSLHLATLPMQKIMGVINQVALPAMARLQEDLPRLRTRVMQAVNLLFFVTTPLLWGVSAVAPEFVAVFLGEKWQAVAFPLAVMSLVVPIRMVSATLWTMVAALGRAEEDLRGTLVNAAVLPLSFLIGVHGGADGLAMAWLVAIPAVMLINLPRITRILGIAFPELLAALRAPALAGVAMLVSIYLARVAFSPMPDPVRLALLIVIGAVVYLGAITQLDREVWKRLRRILSSGPAVDAAQQPASTSG